MPARAVSGIVSLSNKREVKALPPTNFPAGSALWLPSAGLVPEPRALGAPSLLQGHMPSPGRKVYGPCQREGFNDVCQTHPEHQGLLRPRALVRSDRICICGPRVTFPSLPAMFTSAPPRGCVVRTEFLHLHVGWGSQGEPHGAAAKT